jgi:MSHA biogenesis protein MshJ
LKKAWQRYCGAFAALKPRERWLLAMAALALAAFLPYMLAIEPALREGRRLATQAETQRKVLQSIQGDTAALVAANADPDAASRERIAGAASRIRALEATLRASQQGLVPPERMTQLLEAMLDRSRGLKVVSLRTLPAAALLARQRAPDAAPVAAADAAAAATADAGIFKHGVELILEGSYADLLNYLEQMERLPTRMFWSRAVLDGSAHPRLLLTISIFTLSLEAAWLSV